MTETYKKTGKKSVPLVITPEMKAEIKDFKDRLVDAASRPDETSEFDRHSVDIIMNELDDYDRNLLIAYYALTDCNAKRLASILNVTDKTVAFHIKKIMNKIKTLNDTPKTPRNQPRINPCD